MPAATNGAGATDPPRDPPRDPKFAKGWAALQEKEANLTAREQRVSRLERASQLAESGKRLEALELLNIKVDAVQDEVLASLRAKTPDELAMEAAQKIEADRLKKAEEAETKRKADEQAAKENEGAQRWQASVDQVAAAVKVSSSDLKMLVAFRITPDQVIGWAYNNGLGFIEKPEQAALAVKAMEDFMRKEAMATGVFTQPAPAPAAPVPAPQQTGTEARAAVSPGTITSRDAGEVPLRSRPAVRETETAHQRAARALADLGHSAR